MSEFAPFSEVFRSPYNEFCAKNHAYPTHVVIGRKELELFHRETEQHRYRVSDPTVTKRIYSGVEILTTDAKSLMHFFIEK